MFTLAFAQNGTTSAPASAGGSLLSMLPIAVIFIIFYFLLIRPQKKQQKEHAAMLKDLAKNDEVVTAGGILGTVVNVQKENDIVTLRIDDNTRIKIQKSSISKVKK